MNEKRIKQTGVMLLVMTLIVGSLWTDYSHGAAAANSTYEKVHTIEPPPKEYTKKLDNPHKETFQLDMWHYAGDGGYWKVGNKGADKIVITDDYLRGKAITSILADTPAEFICELPAEVLSEIANGNKILAWIKPTGMHQLDKLFDINSLNFKIEGNTMHFKALPKFEIINTREKNFQDFPFMPKQTYKIPFVKPGFGYNIFAIWKSKAEGLGQAKGWINEKDPYSMNGMPAGRIHPLMIKDGNGYLQSGYDVFVGTPTNQNLKSDNIRIGWDSFQNSAACGLHFEYPVEFVFYSAPNTPAATECTACGDILKEGTTETKCSATACKDWGKPGCGCTVINDPIVIIPPPVSGCNDVIEWSERENPEKHIYYHSTGCKPKTNGIGKYCPGHECTHIHYYKTSLSANAVLSPTTLKSGYGFTVSVNSTITTKQTSDAGSCLAVTKQHRTKTAVKKPTPPSKAEVRVGWTVKMKMANKTTQTQPNIIALGKVSSTATASKFQAAPNKVSETKQRKIYTDVAIKGTKEKPVKHNVVIYVSGGGVPGVAEFCKSITKQITINGSMYEDDYVIE